MVQRPIVINAGNHAAMMVLGMFVGALLAAGWFGVGQPQVVHATATHGEGNFAIATGPAAGGIEAFYFLDFLTGDLRAAVVSRRTGEFSALFEYNVQGDFEDTKNPKYLMVTGLADLPRGRGNSQLGNSLIYIAEATTGQVNAYVPLANSSGPVLSMLPAGRSARLLYVIKSKGFSCRFRSMGSCEKLRPKRRLPNYLKHCSSTHAPWPSNSTGSWCRAPTTLIRGSQKAISSKSSPSSAAGRIATKNTKNMKISSFKNHG